MRVELEAGLGGEPRVTLCCDVLPGSDRALGEIVILVCRLHGVVVGVFENTFDWTAIGTLALAAATFVSLFFARRSLKQTQDEIALSRREVEEAHRPVVVPLADLRVIEVAGPEGRAVMPAMPTADPDMLFVPVENIGTGPALDIEASVKLLNRAGGWSPVAGGEQPGAAVALGSSSRILLQLKVPRLSDLPGFSLTLVYSDVAGKNWATTARFVPDRGRYEALRIDASDKGAFSLQQARELFGPSD